MNLLVIFPSTEKIYFKEKVKLNIVTIENAMR